MTYRIHLFVGLVALLFNGATSAQNCQLIAVPHKVEEYKVQSDDGYNKGYIALENDGTWFAWIASKGALNQTFVDQATAADVVCTNGNGL